MPGLKWILHGNEYWYAEAESRSVRKEHGRETRKPRIQEIDGFARSKGAPFRKRPLQKPGSVTARLIASAKKQPRKARV
jgi:hypothetical protein